MPIAVTPQPAPDPAPVPLPEPWSWNVPQLMVHLTANQQQMVMGRLRSIGAIGPDVQTWPTV
jgi:hypothetical protein